VFSSENRHSHGILWSDQGTDILSPNPVSPHGVGEKRGTVLNSRERNRKYTSLPIYIYRKINYIFNYIHISKEFQIVKYMKSVGEQKVYEGEGRTDQTTPSESQNENS
jgi:hypothetical protein